MNFLAERSMSLARCPRRLRVVCGAMSLAFFASDIAGSPVSILRAGQAPPASRSVNDGVYTAEQAKRGADLYEARCNFCHGARLEGDSGPALDFDALIKFWDGRPVSDLVGTILDTMPADEPGTLTRQQATDIVALLLKVSKYPEGENELAQDVNLQRQIVLQKPK